MSSSSKKWYKSKTVWFNVISFVASINPASAALLGPKGIALVAAANVALRLISKDLVTIK